MKSLVLAGKTVCAAGFTSLLMAIMPVNAADMPVPAYKAPPVVVEPSSGWTYQATAYGWATAINGETGVRNLPPVDVDVSAWDALKHLDGALMGSFLAKNDKWLILTDLIYANLSAGGTFGRNDTGVDVSLTQIIASGLIGYRLPLGLPENVELSATVGFRYQHLKADVDISPTLFPVEISREGTKQWIDPTVGFSLHYDINEKWYLNVIADVGGFGVSSKLTAQGFAALGYMWTPSISSAIGYRAIYTDYENDGFVYDLTQHGAFMSLAYHF